MINPQASLLPIPAELDRSRAGWPFAFEHSGGEVLLFFRFFLPPPLSSASFHQKTACFCPITMIQTY
jgi:hypothetical protein